MVAHTGNPPLYNINQEPGHVNVTFDGSTNERMGKGEVKQPKEEVDPFAVDNIGISNDGTPWKEMTTSEKVKRAALNTFKVIIALGFLYLFICSLGFLSSSFRLIAGRTTGQVMQKMQNDYMKNPIVGLMIGILVTVLVQSSSTSTSIIVSMVSADIIGVPPATYMIMGSNIGTSVTNTIVSLTQVGDRNEFRRAFAGATVHDMFNWLSVIVLLTIEVTTGMLEKMTSVMVSKLAGSGGKGTKIKLLKVITDPFTKLIVQLDKKVLKAWSLNDPSGVNKTSLIKHCSDDRCKFLFSDTGLSDAVIGSILLVCSLVILCTSLILIVKILNSMMKGKMAMIIKKTINADIPYVPWITGYIAILVGAVMTFLVQSSSIFTSTLTPLIGIGVISVDRAYPLTLGSNIGTTTTALLASMAGEGQGLKNAMQIALVHLFFNIFGILLFYPIPFTRFPVPLAKKLGDITAKYRWFAIFYLFVMFFLLPGFVFLLSLGGPWALGIVGIPLLVIFVLTVAINIIQNKRPSLLPKKLQDWEWLPKPLHSLQPYDACCLSLPCCRSCRTADRDTRDLQVVQVTKVNGVENNAFDSNDTRL